MNSLVVPSIDIPVIKDIPVLGEIISGHNLLTYGALLSVAVVYLLINKSPTPCDSRASLAINLPIGQVLGQIEVR